MTTYTAKPADINRKWFVVDATDLVLGRSMDCGDNVIIINAEKVHLTGKKLENKKYYWHTGFPGGIKETDPARILAGKFPERVVKKAIQRMISRNPLGRKQLTKLHVYAGSDHPHVAQKPEALDLASKNPKNNKVRK
jgi:large subunit ribosomal protein L13